MAIKRAERNTLAREEWKACVVVLRSSSSSWFLTNNGAPARVDVVDDWRARKWIMRIMIFVGASESFGKRVAIGSKAKQVCLGSILSEGWLEGGLKLISCVSDYFRVCFNVFLIFVHKLSNLVLYSFWNSYTYKSWYLIMVIFLHTQTCTRSYLQRLRMNETTKKSKISISSGLAMSRGFSTMTWHKTKIPPEGFAANISRQAHRHQKHQPLETPTANKK